MEEAGYALKKKAACHGGEYCSPCPFCKEGDDRFLVWPERYNKNNEYQGGRFSCRVCEKYGDAITFLRELHGLTYLEACNRLKIQPKERNSNPVSRSKPPLPIATDPNPKWLAKSQAFVKWCHEQLIKNKEAFKLIAERGFSIDSVIRFKLGFNAGEKGKDIFRDREDWGLTAETKENGKLTRQWLPRGLIIPTFSLNGGVIKVKIRRSEWKEGDNLPKYVELSGSKKSPSIYGSQSLSVALVLESELDALLVQQEAADLLYCVALGGSTKYLDAQTDQLLRNTSLILFLPDFDKAGAVAWDKWKKMFPNIHRILTPCEKSAGDYFLIGGDLREWIEDNIKQIQSKLCKA